MYVVLSIVKSIFLGLIVAYISLIGTFLGHTLLGFSGREQSDQFYLSNMIITVFIAISVGELYKKLNQPYIERAICIFIYHYFFFYGFSFFDKIGGGNQLMVVSDLISQIVPALFFALSVAFFWQPRQHDVSFLQQLKWYFQNTRYEIWFIKFLLGWLVFIPISYFTNLLILPFLEQYSPNIVQSDSHMVWLLKLFMGGVFVLVTLPIFIRWTYSKTALLSWIGFPIFLQIAVSPALVEFWLPIGFRFPVFIQNTVISLLMAIFYVHLYFIPKEDEIIDDQFKWLY